MLSASCLLVATSIALHADHCLVSVQPTDYITQSHIENALAKGGFGYLGPMQSTFRTYSVEGSAAQVVAYLAKCAPVNSFSVIVDDGSRRLRDVTDLDRVDGWIEALPEKVKQVGSLEHRIARSYRDRSKKFSKVEYRPCAYLTRDGKYVVGFYVRGLCDGQSISWQLKM